MLTHAQTRCSRREGDVVTFSTVAVLYAFTSDGQLASWFFHPERAALDEKRNELAAAGLRCEVREYGKRDPALAFAAGLVGSVVAIALTYAERHVAWAIAHEWERGSIPRTADAVVAYVTKALTVAGRPLAEGDDVRLLKGVRDALTSFEVKEAVP